MLGGIMAEIPFGSKPHQSGLSRQIFQGIKDGAGVLGKAPYTLICF